jgi:predicted NBD/HSP70 family sugar kinase/DNA-binding MarR family transcriptional regulator
VGIEPVGEDLREKLGLTKTLDGAAELTGTKTASTSTNPSRLIVLKALIERGPLSRSQLADVASLSRSILTGITHDLIDLGLLQELSVAHDRKQRGRPSILISINPEHAYFVGICITDTPPLMVLTDLHGNIVSQHQIAAQSEPARVVASIRAGIQRLIRTPNINPKRIFGIGLGISGFVDPTNQICRYSAMLDWHDVPIAEMVRRATGIPTFIDNDANAVAIGENLFGEARSLKDFSIITLGGSIGGAHYINGKLHRGHDGGAGEIGHITVQPGGQLCNCGKKGCVDMIASANAIVLAAQGQGLPVQTVREIEVLAANRSTSAIKILRESGQNLGIAVASVIQINNPELVLFVDIIGFGNGLFTTTVRQTIENNILPRFLSSTKLSFHQVEQSFLARGAASIAAHQYLLVRVAK